MTQADAAFSRLAAALGPYLNDLVFIGGWAHRLFPLHEAVSPVNFVPLMTVDADIATRTGLRASPSIDQLLRDAGFQPEFKGDTRPPATHYHLAAGASGFYAEFLVNQRGSGRRRGGEPDDTVTVAGVVAQKLRYIDLLLARPWVVRLETASTFPVGPSGLQLQVCNPASFIAQKLLIFEDRRPADQAKDLLYIHDTLLMVAGVLPTMHSLWLEISIGLHPKQRQRVLQARDVLLGSVTDRIRDAAEIAKLTGRPSPPTPDWLLQVCQAGLSEIYFLPPE